MTGPASITQSTLGGGVLRWELARPQRRNAIDPVGLQWIARRCRDLTGQIVVLTGRGDEAFCAGFDLDALQAHDDPKLLPDAALVEATNAMVAADATFVAAIGGYAIGAGVELCCACDLRIARRGVHFSVPAGRLGVVYPPSGLERIRRVFGPALARSLVLLGRRVSAEEAWAAGALQEVVDDDGLASAVDRMVADLQAGAPHSLAAHRDRLRQLDGSGPTMAHNEAYERMRREAYAALRQRQARPGRTEDP